MPKIRDLAFKMKTTSRVRQNAKIQMLAGTVLASLEPSANIREKRSQSAVPTEINALSPRKRPSPQASFFPPRPTSSPRNHSSVPSVNHPAGREGVVARVEAGVAKGAVPHVVEERVDKLGVLDYVCADEVARAADDPAPAVGDEGDAFCGTPFW